MGTDNQLSRWTKVLDVPSRTKNTAERHLAILADHPKAARFRRTLLIAKKQVAAGFTTPASALRRRTK